MDDRNYWLDLFTGKTWEEFLEAGGSISGFREHRKKIAQEIKPGDYFVCYVTGVSRFIGILEAKSKAFKGDDSIWSDEDFPIRFDVEVVVSVPPEAAVPVKQLRDRLSFFQEMKSPHSWTGHFRGSPSRWENADGEAVLEALLEAKANPTELPVDRQKWDRRPRALQAKQLGAVTIPEREDEAAADDIAEDGAVIGSGKSKRPSDHDEIQWLLLKLGSEMGLDVWVARNDQGKECHGEVFADRAACRCAGPASPLRSRSPPAPRCPARPQDARMLLDRPGRSTAPSGVAPRS